MFAALEQGNTEEFKRLLRHERTLPRRKNSQSKTLLHIAISQCSSAIVQVRRTVQLSIKELVSQLTVNDSEDGTRERKNAA